MTKVPMPGCATSSVLRPPVAVLADVLAEELDDLASDLLKVARGEVPGPSRHTAHRRVLGGRASRGRRSRLWLVSGVAVWASSMRHAGVWRGTRSAVVNT